MQCDKGDRTPPINLGWFEMAAMTLETPSGVVVDFVWVAEMPCAMWINRNLPNEKMDVVNFRSPVSSSHTHTLSFHGSFFYVNGTKSSQSMYFL